MHKFVFIIGHLYGRFGELRGTCEQEFDPSIRSKIWDGVMGAQGQYWIVEAESEYDALIKGRAEAFITGWSAEGTVSSLVPLRDDGSLGY